MIMSWALHEQWCLSEVAILKPKAARDILAQVEARTVKFSPRVMEALLIKAAEDYEQKAAS